ncbi:hypothetical protein PR048_025727 [Dryococelus australis]|uniref:Uncharacterized protein n=1 Tax=Dryococelus australis TaxID=614101 RepID=A0ABQ9GJD4_9NEOP|nr:hypothetical protein PR048_025727 [Dryococelus australis]
MHVRPSKTVHRSSAGHGGLVRAAVSRLASGEDTTAVRNRCGSRTERFRYSLLTDIRVLRADADEVGWVWNGAGMQGLGKRGIPEQARRPASSFSKIPTCEYPGSDPAGNRARFALVRGDKQRAGCPQLYEPASCVTRRRTDSRAVLHAAIGAT